MSVSISRGKTDETIERIKSALDHYQSDNPNSCIDLYRHSPYAVRVRIVDPRFASMSRRDRHGSVWNYFDTLSDETVNDITMLVLIAPGEAKSSGANIDFEDPVPGSS
jgi:hypothetical protein